jgi:hypothetical protein
MSRGTVITLVVVGCILLAVANVSLWAAYNVFNPDRFGEHVAEGMQSPASTEALAVPIVDAVMAEFPEVPRLLSGPAEDAVAKLLQQSVFTTVFRETAAVASSVMTTSAEDVIGIDLSDMISDAGTTVVGVISALDEEAGATAQAALDASLEASQEGGLLEIYESGLSPELRTLSNITPWLALLAGIGAIALLVVAAMRAQDRHEALKYTGVGVSVTAVLGILLFVPAAQALAQKGLTDTPVIQVVVGEVVSVFSRSFAIQSLLLLVIGVVVLVVNHFQAKKDPQADGPEAAPQQA